MPAVHRSASSPDLSPDLWHSSAAPGGPWVKRDISASTLAAAGKHVAVPPLNEAAAVAWKARRKPTIQGQVGTGNKISSVVQYPISTMDPHNLCQGFKNHLSAEDRRILRVRVKHHMRGKPNYPDCVYMVENQLLKHFNKSPELCTVFYCNDEFATQMLTQAALTYLTGGSAANPMRAGVPGKPASELAGLWEESFAVKSRVAAGNFIDSVSAVTQHLSMHTSAYSQGR
mmetsp:Transcript_95402/g.309143  ORF Transcript_95402/g.309143 Transcript_95402/m.309143 type:complete len:229 (-) Transcript_95402:117-803(-)|eukprot:CAMPEP_0203919832 /NCGR_PEP_ID=MMETSP0359-20131031/60190_1 /ASSEMBLY_ACC=CAM_ASM_000338 /TAXON_ID=268821 /ORGANISM="Scrippsiella Hangoei, Strain SHTV-5" /LENGTH=228 /DNA_ID=CAMNT_0050847205 /DNA_START=37 /DNA_END=723 /DNA_ORIENTATION=+